MKFEYFGGYQRSPEWFALRRGRVTASRLDDWLSVSKSKNTLGAPLKKRLDYEKEIQFERQFGVSYENYVSGPMQDGIDFENFAVEQYEKNTGNKVAQVGAWYNEYFCASPDGDITEKGEVEPEGGAEVKVVKDNTFSEILSEGVPDKHWKQVQGQLWASGRKWCDYIAINLNTKKVKVIRVMPDAEFHKLLGTAVAEPITVEPFSEEGLYDFVDVAPEGARPLVTTDFSDNTPSGF